MRYITFLFIMFLMVSCNVKTTITEPTGEQFTVESKSDAHVTYQTEDMKVTVDNRGKPSLLERIAELWTVRWMERAGEDE
jgi:hypothetical protein